MSGRCLCGAVRFVAEGVESEFDACHCGMCRRWTGGPFFTSRAQSVVFEGTAALVRYPSSDWAERGFCRFCGSTLFYYLKPTETFAMSVGAFDDSSAFRLSEEYLHRQKTGRICDGRRPPALDRGRDLGEVRLFRELTTHFPATGRVTCRRSERRRNRRRRARSGIEPRRGTRIGKRSPKGQSLPDVRPQPLIAVRDVEASAAGTRDFSAPSAWGGDTHGNLYDRVLSRGRLILQLHAWDRENHPNLVAREGQRRSGTACSFGSSSTTSMPPFNARAP